MTKEDCEKQINDLKILLREALEQMFSDDIDRKQAFKRLVERKLKE